MHNPSPWECVWPLFVTRKWCIILAHVSTARKKRMKTSAFNDGTFLVGIENKNWELPGGLAVKDLMLSLLWLRFDPWPGSFHMSACHGYSQKKKKKKKKKENKNSFLAGIIASKLWRKSKKRKKNFKLKVIIFPSIP